MTIKTTIRLIIIAVICILWSSYTGESPYLAIAQSEFSCSSVSEIPQSECEALVAIYNHTDGTNWNNSRGWLITDTPCSWFGVTCREGHVMGLTLTTRINVTKLGVKGSIPKEIGDLVYLESINLWNNQVSSLPEQIGNLNNLTSLNLKDNHVTSLPSGIGRLGRLTSLELSYNYLNSIPAEIGNLNNLISLRLSGNQLIGIPAEIGNLYSLTLLSLGNNQLTSIPTEIGNLYNLTSLGLNSNQLSTLPRNFMNLTNLASLSLDNNSLRVTDEALIHWMNINDPDWADTQGFEITLTPTNTPTPTSTSTSTPTYTPTFTSTPTNTPTPTHTPTPPPPDSYEFDNECSNSSTILANHSMQEHTFHILGDVDWVQFTAPTTGTYRVEVDIPGGSLADVDLTYYTECSTLAVDQWDETFTPGARVDIAATEGETFYLKLTQFDDSVAGANANYHISVRLLPQVDEDAEVRRAVIIVAGRYRLQDPLQDNINDTAKRVYQLFQSQDVTAEDIRLLAASNIANVDVDDDVTEENLRLAITDWAVQRLTPDDGRPVNAVFTLYIIDHGDPDLIYLDKFKEEYLHAEDLNDWLGQLEAAVPNVLTNVIIEACHSGSFIEERDNNSNDSISAPNRVIIASTSSESDAYASNRGIHFSDAFITLLHQGRDLAKSFFVASENVSNLYNSQEPWLDANGNGIHNELEDGLIAGQRGFNHTGTLGHDNWPPYIFSATMPDGIQDRSGTIVVDVRDNQSVQSVWAVIYPPDYVVPTIEHELVGEQLDTILLTRQVGHQVAGTYHGFRTCGPYRIVIHARDADGLQARPEVLTVYSSYCQFLPVISR